MNTNNFKLFANEDISAISTSKEVSEQLGLEDFRSIEIQIDWSDLTGTLNAQVKISQRVEHSMNYTCLQTDESKSNTMIKTLNTAAGSYTFLLWAFNAIDIKVEIIKNSCTGGLVSGGMGIRK